MSDRGLYVYGVVPGDAPAALFADVRGVDPSEPVVLVHDGGVAAVASAVRLDEFGEEAIERNLRDPRWLADKARAHDDVLAAAVGRTTVLPFRFGTIYRDEHQILDLLRDRTDFASTLDRLAGSFELGLKAFVDVEAVTEALAAGNEVDDDASAGRAYMQRKQRARELDEKVEQSMAGWAQETHDRLREVTIAARLNALQQPEDPTSPRRMILNAAYLVENNREPRFREEVAALGDAYGAKGIEYELTGPWPAYNFTEDEDSS